MAKKKYLTETEMLEQFRNSFGNAKKQTEIATIMADFGYYKLNKDILLLDVRKENKKVINYHLLKKPLIYTEDELNYYYLIIKQQWEKAKNNILSYFEIDQKEYNSFKNNFNI